MPPLFAERSLPLTLYSRAAGAAEVCMFSRRIRRGWVLSALAAAGTGVLADARAADPRPVPPRRPATPSSPVRPAPTVLDLVPVEYRESIAAVVRQPTLSAKAREEDFPAHAAVYDWLLANPDRVALAWKRMKVPCVDITPLGEGKFSWHDDKGSELTWQTVGRFADGMIWYATGKVKPGPLLPVVPVKAVAVLHAPRATLNDGTAILKPAVSVYLLTDSRTAGAVLRMVGPAGPRMAEQGAEQLLLFFSALAAHLYKEPEKIETLLAPATRKE